MRFNNLAALLAISQTAIALTSEDIPTPITTPTSDSIQSTQAATTEAPIQSTVSEDDTCTDLPESEPTSSSTSVPTSVGRETVSILNVVTVQNARKRAPAVVTQAATVAVCPIYASQVPDEPCYPCAVGEPTGQQFLGVQTVSLS